MSINLRMKSKEELRLDSLNARSFKQFLMIVSWWIWVLTGPK